MAFLDLHQGILEEFASHAGAEMEWRNALDWRQRKAAYQAAYDADRAKLLRCVPEFLQKRRESQSEYEARKWQRTRADATLRAQHNAKRRAAHERLKRDPVRQAVAKAKQAEHSKRHALRRTKLRAAKSDSEGN